MSETTSRGIQATLFDYFQDTEYFTIQEANELVLEHQNRDVNTESIRARIYEGVEKGLFERVGKGLYMVTRDNEDGSKSNCLLINGDGRDLSMFPDNSVDAIITDHPWAVTKSLKGGNRNFANYELFEYTEEDFRSKHRILRPGHFLVEFLPEENADNYQYLFKVKEMARKAGMEYYAKVAWKKGDFVANTGRKSKNVEDVCFFTKGRARELRPDAKKDKAEPGVAHYMSGANGMLPANFDVSPPNKKDRIHQAEKPVELLEQILNFVTLPGETALDQFAGSGVLGVAALNTGRNSILIEKDEETFKRLTERLQVLGKIKAVSDEAKAFISIGIDALIAEDAYRRTQDDSIPLNFQKSHEINPSEILEAHLEMKKAVDYDKEKCQAMAGANDAIIRMDIRADNIKSAQSHLEGAEALQIGDASESRQDNPKVLECSSMGDRRFSALFAMISIKGREQSIEEWYQNSKRTADGKKAGKGKPFHHIVDPFTGDALPAKDAVDLYRGLWITYLNNHPDLVAYAAQFDDYSDVFQTSRKELTFEEIEAGLTPDLTISPADVVGAYVKGNTENYIASVKSGHWYKNMLHKQRRELSDLESKIQAAQIAGSIGAGEQASSSRDKENGSDSYSHRDMGR